MRLYFFALFIILGATIQSSSAGSPVIDYHQHLLSPTMATMWSRPLLKEIQVPQEFKELLAAREKAFGKKDELALLYTEDSVLFDPLDSAWLHGRNEIADYLAGIFRAPYNLTPVAYTMKESSGSVAGYLTRGEGSEKKHFAHFHASLVKGADGNWRIAAESFVNKGPVILKQIVADDLIQLLNDAEIRKAVVLSAAYAYGDADLVPPVENEYDKVRAENDWTAQQVSRYPDRLVGFCGVNPLKDYALRELDRCAKEIKLRGLKLHFGNSRVDVRDPEHLKKIKSIFRKANELRLPIVAHIFRGEKWYGQQTSEVFLNEILPEAPDVVVQIAHMAGSGPGYQSDEAFAVFSKALAAKDPRTKNLYFDVTTVVTTERTDSETAKLLAMRIREAGLSRVLYGSDMAIYGNAPPRTGWGMFRGLLPLSDEEFRTIANNIAPYMK